MNAEGGNATLTGRITPPLKWHVDGGKGHLATRIVALMPPHLCYVEPYAGGLSVLFARDPSNCSEVVNDLHADLSNFWTVLQDADSWHQFRRIVEAIPFSESEFDRARTATVFGTDIDRAVNFFVRCRQSLAGRMKAFTGVTKTRTRRGMNNEVSAWLSAVEGLPAVHERLKRVLILNRPALDVIRGQDGEHTLMYLDPPYLHETRAAKDVYEHEMSAAQHAELLLTLSTLKGKFLLSGYRSELYDTAASKFGWSRVDFDIANHSAGGKKKRRMVESVWLNYDQPTEQTA